MRVGLASRMFLEYSYYLKVLRRVDYNHKSSILIIVGRGWLNHALFVVCRTI